MNKQGTGHQNSNKGPLKKPHPDGGAVKGANDDECIQCAKSMCVWQLQPIVNIRKATK